MEIEIRGHSGCQIDIVNGGDSLFINKSTRDKNYIPRLYKQALKQCNASKIAYQHIRVPKIYGIELHYGFGHANFRSGHTSHHSCTFFLLTTCQYRQCKKDIHQFFHIC